MDTLRVLEKAGLTPNEARIYHSLLRLGSAKAGKLAKESELNRSSTYGALQSLLQKGLSSYVLIGKVRWFQASDPQNLARYFQDRMENLRETLPALSKIYHAQRLPQNVRLFKGARGVKTILQEIINDAKPNHVFGSEGQLAELLPVFSKKFEIALKKKRVLVRSIIRHGRNVSDTRYRKVRFLRIKAESPMVTNIFGDKIAIILWGVSPEAVLIENRAAAVAYREYFDFMWKNAKTK